MRRFYAIICASGIVFASASAGAQSLPAPPPSQPQAAPAPAAAYAPAPAQTGGVSAPAGYTLSANDQVAVEVFGEDDLRTNGRLNGEGNLSLPLLGSVQLAGMTLTQAAVAADRALRQGLSGQSARERHARRLRQAPFHRPRPGQSPRKLRNARWQPRRNRSSGSSGHGGRLHPHRCPGPHQCSTSGARWRSSSASRCSKSRQRRRGLPRSPRRYGDCRREHLLSSARKHRPGSVRCSGDNPERDRSFSRMFSIAK